MNSAKTTKKKLSEYQVEDLKEIFLEVLKKISSKEKKLIVCFGSLYNCGNILNKN